MELATSFTKDLPRKLAPEEVAERSSMLARITEEIAEVEAEAKKIASQFGQKIKGLRLRQITLAHSVNSHEEASPVLCSERADLRRFQILTYRHDTSETVDQRAMTQDEVEEARQSNLFPNVRVATEAKKGNGTLDLSTPPKEDAKPEGAAAALAGAFAGTPPPAEGAAGEPDDGPVISDPGAVLAGKVPPPPAEASTTKRRRNSRGGLRVVGSDDSKPGGADAEIAELAKDQAKDDASDASEKPDDDDGAGDGS